MAVTPGAIPIGTTALIFKKGTYVPVEGTLGTFTDTIQITQPDGTVTNRQVLVIGDPEDPDARIRLEEFSFAAEARFASPVTGPELKNLCELMTVLIQETRLSNRYNSLLVGEELNIEDVDDSEDL